MFKYKYYLIFLIKFCMNYNIGHNSFKSNKKPKLYCFNKFPGKNELCKTFKVPNKHFVLHINLIKLKTS